jgi:hypothetical protein
MMNREFWLIYKNLVSIFAFVGVVLGFAINTQAQTCSPAPVGLVSWYPGDGTALDSRSRNDGTLQNGATFAAGRVGQAFNLDGVDDSVQIPHNANLNVNGSFTGEAWIFPRTIQNNSPRIFEKIGGGGGFLFAVDQNQSLNATINSVFTQSTSGSVPLNQWTHAAFTYNGTTGEIKLYINGVLSGSIIGPVQTTGSTAPLFIGNQSTNVRQFDGLIDEPAIYNRELLASEIQAIFNAGTMGKCKPTATVSPSGQVAWWSGDGNANDIAGNNNNGVLMNGAGFAVGKVGQSFVLDGGYVEVIDSPTLEVTTQLTIESWIKPSDTNQFRQIVSKFGATGNYAYQIGLAPNGALRTDLSQTGGPAYEQLTSPANVIMANAWNHVAVTFNAGVTTLYVNGNSVVSATLPINSIFGSGNTNVNIGRDPAGLQYFSGIIDEASIYNRALSAIEIQAIFNAGQAGKLKTANTPTGFADLGLGSADSGFEKRDQQSAIQNPQSVTTTIGDVTVTFQSVSVGGATQEIPLDPSLLPLLPNVVTFAGLTYDVATSAVYSGNVDLCFNLTALAALNFNNLRVYHLESGAWVNRTAIGNVSPSLCTSGVTSLSPFAIANFTPTAASVSVSGRITDSLGNGIARVRVSITGANGATRAATTNSFGFYRFDEILAGETYVISAASKRYQFSQPTQVILVNDALDGIDFTAVE